MTSEDARQWLAAIVDSSDDAIVGKRLDGTIVSWNTGAERIFGYTAAEMIGQSVLKLFPPELVGEENEIVGRLKRGQRIDHFESVRVTKNGHRIEVSLSVSPILDGKGNVVGAAKIARDITEAKALQAALRTLNERLEQQAEELKSTNEELLSALDVANAAQAEAEAANRVKSDFLASMSHELRTPLNAISGYADLIDAEVAGQIPEVYHRYLDNIRKAQSHLQHLISNVLDFAKIEAGRLLVQARPVAVVDLLERIEPMVVPQAISKGLSLRMEEPAADLRVQADADRVIQILLNLVANAIKFTPGGGSVTVRASSRGTRVAISVQDTGPGIAPANHERVFEPFVQVEPSLTRSHQGTGLGLAISRELARAMNGDVTLESARGRGATFALVLPRAE